MKVLRLLVLVAAVAAILPSAAMALPWAMLQVGGDQYSWDETDFDFDGSVYTFDFSVAGTNDSYSVSGSVLSKHDPYASYGIQFTNNSGGDLGIYFSFATPMMSVTSPTLVYASMSGSLTDISGDGVEVTPIDSDDDGDGIDEAQGTYFWDGSDWVNGGVDVGPHYAHGPGVPGHSDVYGAFQSGPQAGPDGTFDRIGMELGFELTDHDIATLNGFSSINVEPVPEPGSLALLGLGLAGVGLAGWRRRRA